MTNTMLFSKKIFDYCILDIETTGLDPNSCEILEIGIRKFVGGKFLDSFRVIVKPKNSIPPEITAINGFTDASVADGACSMDAVSKARRFVGDMLIVGHNIMFDISFLNKHGDNMFNNVKFIDTRELSIDLLKDRISRFRQTDLERYYNVVNDGKHTAEGDTKALGDIFACMIKEFNNVDFLKYIRR